MYPPKTTAAGISQIAMLLSDPANTEDVAKAHLLLGLEAEARQDWQDAANNYIRILELAPANDMVRYFGHNNLAYSLLQLQQFDDAEAHSIAAIEIDDARPDAIMNCGLACEALGRPAEAAVCFLNAASRNVADKRAWMHLQQLVSKHPELLAQSAELAARMADLRGFHETHGGVSAAN